MKKVWLRVSECVTVDVAAKQLESLGYKIVWGDFRPESPNAIVGEHNGEIRWDTDLDFLFNYGYEEIFITTAKHKHYDLIVAWAKNPSQKVWQSIDGIIYSQTDRPCWDADYTYHIGEQPPKRKIMIGGVEIDAPETIAPDCGTDYFVADPSDELYVGVIVDWDGDDYDIHVLKRGLVHLNKEAAIAHAKALIKVSGGCVDE